MATRTPTYTHGTALAKPGGRTFRRVFALHAVVLGGLLAWSVVPSCRRPTYDVIEVVTVKNLPPAESAAADDLPDAAADEEAPAEEPAERLRSVEEIRRSALRAVESEPRRVESQPRREVDTRAISDALRRELEAANVSVDVPDSVSAETSTRSINDYIGAFTMILRRAWKQPSMATVPPGKRTVTVKITIGGDGKILGHRIVDSSGSAVMDQSIEDIFGRVRKLPAPSEYGIRSARFSQRVTFELVD